MEIQQTQITGTTNSQGTLQLGSLGSNITVLDVSVPNNTEAMCIPWLYNGIGWYAKVLNWQTMAVKANTSITAIVRYIHV